jgi:6-phosphogluconolactonase
MACLRLVSMVLATVLLQACFLAGASGADKVSVYFGTYTRPGASKGIYLSQFDMETGKLSDPVLAAETTNPSFLALHPTRPLVYAVGEMGSFDGKKTGAVSAFARDPASGKLTLLNQQSTQNTGPCHVTVDPSGRCVLVANYGGGSVASLPIKNDGSLGEAVSHMQHSGSSVDQRRQKGPHAHSIQVDPTGRFAVSPDLGIDKVMIYRLDPAAAKLAPNDPPFAAVPPGSGPRHFAFHPNGRFAYVINEMLSTVTAFRYDSQRGALDSIETVSTLPKGFDGPNTTAEVQVHPSGKFVYGSNRGHDSIAIFAVDQETGKLKHLGNQPSQGRTPRNFGIDPTGTFLLAAHQDSNNVVVFRIDAKTGRLSPAGHSILVHMPVCVKFLVQKKGEVSASGGQSNDDPMLVGG